MKLLTFLADRFAWRPFSRTLEDAQEEPPADGLEDAVVVFFHAEAADADEELQAKVFKKTLKHVKWLAGKKEFKNVVLHSFTHLGGDTASPEFARGFAARLEERLVGTGYTVKTTPFGWFCSWEISVLGDSLAKVWKEI